MKNHIYLAHNVLLSVYSDGKQLDEALEGRWMTDMATRLVRGVLEEDIKLNYILSQLVKKKPQLKVYVLLKIGVYALLELNDVPAFAIVSECVEVCKAIGKQAVCGFVNATLKRASTHCFALPAESDPQYLSVTYGKPQWFIDKCFSQFGDDALKIISAKGDYREHIRLNGNLTTPQELEAVFNDEKIEFEKTEHGYLVGLEDIRQLFNKGIVTIQSPSSVMAVKYLDISDGNSVLDVCAAPGGKAVYAAELTPHGSVTACDLSSRRVAQLSAYIERMHTPNVVVRQADASIYEADFAEKFDRVLVDAPCSCFGTFLKHPDIFLRRDYSNIAELNALQRAILQNSAQYVKCGGALVYCVCTLFKEECENIVSALDGLTLVKTERVLPGGAYDGFYIAKFIKQ